MKCFKIQKGATANEILYIRKYVHEMETFSILAGALSVHQSELYPTSHNLGTRLAIFPVFSICPFLFDYPAMPANTSVRLNTGTEMPTVGLGMNLFIASQFFQIILSKYIYMTTQAHGSLRPEPLRLLLPMH
jgi:hypothetical protein